MVPNRIRGQVSAWRQWWRGVPWWVKVMASTAGAVGAWAADRAFGNPVWEWVTNPRYDPWGRLRALEAAEKAQEKTS